MCFSNGGSTPGPRCSGGDLLFTVVQCWIRCSGGDLLFSVGYGVAVVTCCLVLDMV